MDFNKVVKLLCRDEDNYFKSGVSELIKEALLTCVNVELLTKYDSESMLCADVILINSSQWRLFMCQPAYRYRKPGSILLVFTNYADDINPALLPICYQSLTTIGRYEAVRQVREKITRAWLAANTPGARFFSHPDCTRCNVNRISLVQLKVMSFIKSGKSISHIARCLGLSVKTVYAHKYIVMKKFHLKGESELHFFLNNSTLVQLYKGIIE